MEIGTMVKYLRDGRTACVTGNANSSNCVPVQFVGDDGNCEPWVTWVPAVDLVEVV